MQMRALLAFDDPGGGLVVSSLLKRLEKIKNINLEIYSGKFSERFLNQNGITFNSLNSNISIAEANIIMDNTLPDILITATSGGNAEQELRNVAFERNIKSVVILDFWKDYSRRWLYSSYPIWEMKEKVCVMDQLTKMEMIQEKFPEQNLFVTGHPYLENIFKKKQSLQNKDNSERNNFLFLSQPLEIIGIKDYKVHPVEILIKAIKKFGICTGKKSTLIIKLHPSEKLSEDLNNIVNSGTQNLQIGLADELESLNNLIRDADIVIGYNTIAMFEARSLSKRTISLNVVPIKNSLTVAMESSGIEIVNLSENEIYECLKKEQSTRFKNKVNVFEGAIENCLRVSLNEL